MLYQTFSRPSLVYSQQPPLVQTASQGSAAYPTRNQQGVCTGTTWHVLQRARAGMPTNLQLLPAGLSSFSAVAGMPPGTGELATAPTALHSATTLRALPAALHGQLPFSIKSAAQVVPSLSTACRAPRGIEQLVSPGAILLFGEVHGTTEIPAAISQILSYVVAQGHGVCLGLELWEPPGRKGFLNNYVCSAGKGADRQALFSLPHWEIQDGRQSKAYFAMIEHARVLRQGGARLEVFGFDAVVNDYRGSTLQSRAMAYNVLAKIASLPKETVFILMAGNGHCCTEACGGREPMGYPIKRKHPNMKAFNVRCASGSHWWGIAPEGPDGEMTAGPHAWSGDGARHLHPIIDTSNAARTPGFDGLLDMGVLTASFPEVAST